MSTYLLGILLWVTLISLPAYSTPSYAFEDPRLSEKQMSDLINIFPNPTDGRFQINLKYEGNEKIAAKVYDITGKMIKDVSNDLVFEESSVTADIDLEHPSSGIYFLRIEIGHKIATKKIIVK